MKKLFIGFFVLAITPLFAEEKNKHPVDFDAEYFRKSPFSRWMRDPFKNPPGFAKATLSKASWPKLNSIKVHDEVPLFAILDGKKYREGQFIDKNRYISNIGQNFVIITEGSFDYELVLPDPDRKVAGGLSEEE